VTEAGEERTMPILLAVLSACVAFLAGGIVVGWRERAAFGRTDGAFFCKLRAANGSPWITGVPARWTRRRSRAVWVHDVLVVHGGLFRPRTLAVPARIPEEPIRYVSDKSIRGLGDTPLVLRLRLDDGDLIDIAANDAHRTLLVGPFLAAAIPGLPRAPTQRRRDR
jgi:hypothetical protein